MEVRLTIIALFCFRLMGLFDLVELYISNWCGLSLFAIA